MILLLEKGPTIPAIRAELAPDIPVEQLITPFTGYKWLGGRYGIDNGAFSHFDAEKFRALLKRMEPNRAQCIFVAAPDIVGAAMRSLEVFEIWKDELAGWPRALVAQDGAENVRIPWDDLAAIFIGGSTEWKLGPHVTHIIKTAKMLGKWVHIGRVNTRNRYEKFLELGADSFDGTGLCRYDWMRRKLKDRPPQLDFEKTA